ncbi:MAG: EcsC family protein [Bradyrhizobium sp.]|nr:MAG: EcsC family protein [Bradyrhizobium sp.]
MTVVEILPPGLSNADLEALRQAVECLEDRSFASRAATLLGRQVETWSRSLPASLRRAAARAAETALNGALKVALRTIDTASPPRAARGAHRAAAAASGAIGGAFGLASTVIELPISTTILMRSIAQIAREEGEDLTQPEGALACLEVFALSDEPGEAAIEGGYFAARGALARSVADSARYLAGHRIAGESAPVLARLIAQIATRFGLVVSEKFAAQAVPVVGAIGGAAVNLAFAQHFQTLARGHFIIRRLERLHGHEAVSAEYRRLRGDASRREA